MASSLSLGLRAHHIWPMLQKEFIHMRRDRLTVAMLVGIPAVQLMLFGFAIRTEVRHLPMVVLDESRTPESRQLAEVLQNTGNFDLVGTVGDRTALRLAIETGRAHAALVIPPDFALRLQQGRGAQAQVIVDAADPLSSGAAINAAAIVSASRALNGAGRGPPPLEVRVRPWYNADLRSSTYIVPGLIGVLLSLTLILVTGMAIVREREKGTLEQLIVTPIEKASLMIGKIVPFILVGYVQMTVVLVLGKLLFDIPVRGSLVLLYVVTIGFIVANLALGLLVSTVTETQGQAMQAGFFLLMPNILLSGFMFPREAMPEAAQWIGNALPLTYYLRILRGILLKGAGFAQIWPDALVLVGFAVGLIVVSSLRFRKTVG
jgi:ABC-2 type transport system permease protein